MDHCAWSTKVYKIWQFVAFICNQVHMVYCYSRHDGSCCAEQVDSVHSTQLFCTWYENNNGPCLLVSPSCHRIFSV